MLRSLLRSLGFLLLSAAFAALIVDATRSIAGGRLLFFSLGESAQWLVPALLKALDQGAASHGLSPFLAGLMGLPTWLVCGAAGAVLLAAGRRPRRRFGST